MKFTYNETEYELVAPDGPEGWTTLEAAQVQMHCGRKPYQVVLDFRELGALGLHALAWVSLRRAGVDVAWEDLVLPHFETQRTIQGDPIEEPEDPSTASTQRRATSRGRRASSAPSTKN